MFECVVCFEESNEPYEDAVGHMATHTESICRKCVGDGNVRACPICRFEFVTPAVMKPDRSMFGQTVTLDFGPEDGELRGEAPVITIPIPNRLPDDRTLDYRNWPMPSHWFDSHRNVGLAPAPVTIPYGTHEISVEDFATMQMLDGITPANMQMSVSMQVPAWTPRLEDVD